MSQFSLLIYQRFVSSLALEVKPIVQGQEGSNYWHFDNNFCRLNDHKKVIILEAIYPQTEKVQNQSQLTTMVKTKGKLLILAKPSADPSSPNSIRKCICSKHLGLSHQPRQYFLRASKVLKEMGGRMMTRIYLIWWWLTFRILQ